jgi:nitroreductase
MDFFDVVAARRSVRSFMKKEIEEEKIRKILEVANSAPSAGNLQAYEIVLVKEHGTKKELAAASHGQDFLAEAPLALVMCANKKRAAYYRERGQNLYCLQDATIAASYIQLAAADLGLGTVWVGAFDEEKISEILSLPEFLRPVAILPLGYPNEKPKKTTRRKISDLVHEEKF